MIKADAELKQPVLVKVPVTVYTVKDLGAAYTEAALPPVYGMVAVASVYKPANGDHA